MDGPVGSSSMMQSTLTTSDSFHFESFGMNVVDESQRELLSGNMSLSVLHLHEVHHRHKSTAVKQHMSSARSNYSFQQAPDSPSIGLSPMSLHERPFPSNTRHNPPSQQEQFEMSALHNIQIPTNYDEDSGPHANSFSEQPHQYNRNFFSEDDSEPSSMPPMPPPPSVTSRMASEPMPQIREDLSGEHELDTSKP